ncbi:24155_t:CDS:1, partial [Gigaspora rosea]
VNQSASKKDDKSHKIISSRQYSRNFRQELRGETIVRISKRFSSIQSAFE